MVVGAARILFTYVDVLGLCNYIRNSLSVVIAVCSLTTDLLRAGETSNHIGAYMHYVFRD